MIANAFLDSSKSLEKLFLKRKQLFNKKLIEKVLKAFFQAIGTYIVSSLINVLASPLEIDEQGSSHRAPVTSSSNNNICISLVTEEFVKDFIPYTIFISRPNDKINIFNFLRQLAQGRGTGSTHDVLGVEEKSCAPCNNLALIHVNENLSEECDLLTRQPGCGGVLSQITPGVFVLAHLT